METVSALLALCVGNSPVPGEFPTQRPVTRRFDAFLGLCLIKWLSKQSRGWWFETLSCPLWSHCNGLRLCCSFMHKERYCYHTNVEGFLCFNSIRLSQLSVYFVLFHFTWCTVNLRDHKFSIYSRNQYMYTPNRSTEWYFVTWIVCERYGSLLIAYSSHLYPI